MENIFNQIKEQNQKHGEIDLEIDNFICKDWNVYYNLYNPENFEDPDNSPEWYDVSDVYEYYETPFSNSDKLTIFSSRKVESLKVLEDFIKHSVEIEKNLLDAIVNYTFGGGAYASGEHYRYAKKTLENLHKTSFTEEDFMKRNVRINTLELEEEGKQLLLHFDCSWDEEHGFQIVFRNKDLISIE